jgi:[ribosomal protein S18]-alanine N-acetyltransferase
VNDLPHDDVDRIMAVMDVAFPPEFGEAWTRRQLCDALLFGRCHYQLIDYFGQPHEGDSPVAGFSLSRGGFEEEELLLIAVVPDARRRGLALAMLRETAAAAQARGARQLLLEMRRGNPAESLYRNFGFAAIGERRNYYRTPDGIRIDAITFALRLE